MYFTERQHRILRFIKQYSEEHRVSPTLSEIAGHCAVTKATIYEHVEQLEQKGALSRVKFHARSIKLPVPVKKPEGAHTMPRVGNLPSDSPAAQPSGCNNINFDEMFAMGKKRFGLRVRGESMLGDHIAAGDVLIIEKKRAAQDGDTVLVAVAGGDATLKVFRRENGRVQLHSLNGNAQAKFAAEPEIHGVVAGVLRRFKRTNAE
jgi:repressor LexA